MAEALFKAAAISRPPFFISWFRQPAAAALIVLAALLAYHNSFSGAFVFDDEPVIENNPSIRQLWPPWSALTPPPGGLTVSGRPLVNLTLAVNYALGGTQVWGYHAVNLGIHALAALVLYGIVRRTLERARLPGIGVGEAASLALAVALLWVVHPLQTEAVTYVVQRTESLTGLFYLLTLYGFICGAETPASGPWLTASVISCVLGMASKEVMVGAPLLVLLYDRTFVAGGFREAWRQRRWYYVGLASTWILLIWLVVGTAGRGGTAGFNSGAPWWAYALTQCRAIVMYLRLSLWPAPLVFDYGIGLVRNPVEVLPQALLVAALLAGTGWALWRRPAIGFLGGWFFVILAPSSSVVPVATQTMAEHRMYLPLAAVMTAVVLALQAGLGRRTLPVCLIFAAALAALTTQRNKDYQSGLALWGDAAAKHPENARAHNNFGLSLFKQGRVKEAKKQYEEALRLNPDYADAHNNLGVLLLGTGENVRAREQCSEAVRLNPASPDGHYNLAVALFRTGEVTLSREQYEETLRINPDSSDAHGNLGMVLVHTGHPAEALPHLQEALRLNPNYPEAYSTLGRALAQTGHRSEAIADFATALRLKPGYAEAENNWGSVLFAMGDAPGAMSHYEAALRFQPDYAEAHFNLANTLAHGGRLDEAIAHYETALRLKPDYAEAEVNFGITLGLAGRLPEAAAHYTAALQLDPHSFEAHVNLANTLARLGQLAEAAVHYEAALRLRPNDAVVRKNFDALRASQP